MQRWYAPPRWILVSAPLLLCGSCSSRVWLTETRDIPPGAATSVQVHTSCGDISVRPSDDELVHVRIQRTALSEREAQSLPVDSGVVGDVVQVQWNGAPGDDGVFFDVEVPTSLSVSLSSGDRSIRVSGIQGMVDATTDAGDIEVDHVTGALTARAHGGHVSVLAHTGQVDLDTAGGDVTVSGALSGASSIATGAGSIDVTIPADSDLTVWASTQAGTASNDFGLPGRSPGDPAAAGFHGTIGTGAAGSLAMQGGAGSIWLHKE